MKNEQTLVLQVDYEDTSEFERVWAAADGTAKTLIEDYVSVPIGEPDRIENFGAETLSMFFVPISHHLNALMGLVLGFWLNFHRITIKVGTIEIKNIQIKDLPAVVSEIKRLQKK